MKLRSVLPLLFLILNFTATAAFAFERISIGPDGAQGSGSSEDGSVSRDGRFVVFSSFSSLVPLDTNGVRDVYVRDRVLKTTELVSATPTGEAGSSFSIRGRISADGSAIVFLSYANDLVPGDTNNETDVFRRDLLTGTTTRISVLSNGSQADASASQPSISDDGSVIVYLSSGENRLGGAAQSNTQIYRVETGDPASLTQVTTAPGGADGDGSSREPSLSGNGMFISYTTNASNIIPSPNSNYEQVFRYNHNDGSTMPVSVGDMAASPDSESSTSSISADGRFVVFVSQSTNLMPTPLDERDRIYVRDMELGETELISGDLTFEYAETAPESISGDGRFIVFDGNVEKDTGMGTSYFQQFHLYDRDSNSSEVILEVPSGQSSASFLAAVSPDGDEIVFNSLSEDLIAGDTNMQSDTFIWPGGLDIGGGNRAAKTRLKKKIKRFQKKAKLAKRKKQVAKAKRFTRKLSALKKQLRRL